jgi:hypothetical protein
MGQFPDTAQFRRLATLGVTDAERAILAQRGYDRVHIADLIASAVRWPLGPDGLRHYRIFHEYPGGAAALADVSEADRNAITAWRHVDAIPSRLEAVFVTGRWHLLDSLGDTAAELADIAADGRVNAVQNPAIEQRIEAATVLLAGYGSRARIAGLIDVHDYATHVAPLPERVRRAGRQWRALAARQYGRALYRVQLRQRLGW